MKGKSLHLLCFIRSPCWEQDRSAPQEQLQIMDCADNLWKWHDQEGSAEKKMSYSGSHGASQNLLSILIALRAGKDHGIEKQTGPFGESATEHLLSILLLSHLLSCISILARKQMQQVNFVQLNIRCHAEYSSYHLHNNQVCYLQLQSQNCQNNDFNISMKREQIICGTVRKALLELKLNLKAY